MKTLKNYLFSLIQQIFVILIPIITLPYVTGTLGLVNIGKYSYSNSIVSMFTLFIVLGVNLYGAREISYYRDDIEKRSNVFFNIIKIKVLALVLVLSVYSFYIIFSDSTYRMLYIIQLLMLIGSTIDISWFYQGMENFKSLALRQLFIKVVLTASLFIFVKTSNDLYVYTALLSISNFAISLILWISIRKELTLKTCKSIKMMFTLKNSLILFIPQAAISLYTVVDKIVVGRIAGESQVGLYDTTQRLVKLLLSIVTALGTVMLAKNANEASKNIENVKKNVFVSSIFMMFISMILLILVVVNSETFISIFLSNEFSEVGKLLQYSAFIMLFITMSNVIGIQLMIPLGGYKRFTITVLIGAVANLSLNFILVPRYLALGAIIATVITEFLVFAIQFFIMREYLFKAALLIENIKYVLMVAILIPLGFILNDKIYLFNGFITICLISCILSVLYLTLCIALRTKVYTISKEFILNKNR